MIDNRVSVRNNIIKNIPILIEVFTRFYGEENREDIENKFNNLVVAGYISPEGYSRVIFDEKKKIANRCMDKFKEETGITSDEEIHTLFGYISDFSYTPIIDRLTYNNNTDIGKSFLLDFLSDYCGEKLPSLEDERVPGLLEELNKILPYALKAKEEFNEEYNRTLKPYDDYLNKLKEISNTIKVRCSRAYLECIKDLLSEKDRNILDGKTSYVSRYDMDSMYIYQSGGDTAFGKSLIESFSLESDEQLKDEKTTEWIINSIKSDRVQYFKKLGIDNGDNYEDYINDPRCIALIPDKATVNRIIETKKQYEQICNNSIMFSLPHHKDIFDEIRDKQLLLNNGITDNFANEIMCISDNYAKEDDNIILRPILFFNGSTGEDIFDCSLIHEMNHLYELCIKEINGDYVTDICGWDIIESSTSVYNKNPNDTPSGTKRKYEMFNEIINELIAQDICKSMHDMGISISGDLNESRNTSMTSYEALLGRFVKGFYNEFKEDIIESRKDGNIETLMDKIGRDNFEEFNDMLSDFSTRFSGMKIYSLNRQIKEQVDNEDTRYYYECMDKKNNLMERFREHKQEYIENNGKNK